ncbi:MAG: hypothetical protein KGL39_36030 [Patescibacteria group bacterium]|nr:hypothetical protein [Patescibacteria group bacterium]
MKTVIITLVLQTEKNDPDLLDKVAGRAYTLDGVRNVEAKLMEPKLIKEVKRDTADA